MDPIQQHSPDSPGTPGSPGVSGRRVTIVVLLGLALVGGWVSYTLWSYNRLDAARANTSEAWRELAEQLSGRYRQVEKLVAQGVDSRTFDMALGERFRLAMDRFRTTAQPPLQYASAMELESFLAQNLDAGILPTQSAPLQSAVDRHNQCLRVEATILNSLGGKFLSWFLKFPAPVELQLAQ